MRRIELSLGEHAPVVVFLREPKEKVWGLLLSIEASGVTLRGLDLDTFEDWLRQEARGHERLIGPLTLFYPMHRIERLERDQSVGPIQSYADRFFAEAGHPVTDAFGFGEDD